MSTPAITPLYDSSHYFINYLRETHFFSLHTFYGFLIPNEVNSFPSEELHIIN